MAPHTLDALPTVGKLPLDKADSFILGKETLG